MYKIYWKEKEHVTEEGSYRWWHSYVVLKPPSFSFHETSLFKYSIVYDVNHVENDMHITQMDLCLWKSIDELHESEDRVYEAVEKLINHDDYLNDSRYIPPCVDDYLGLYPMYVAASYELKSVVRLFLQRGVKPIIMVPIGRDLLKEEIAKKTLLEAFRSFELKSVKPAKIERINEQ